MDRISHLPDFLIHHILSSLNTSDDPPVELVRMSVLSKTWFDLTASFPFLEFYMNDDISRESFFKYIEYATSRFCHQNLTTHRFTLSANIRDPAELDIVNRCLGLVLRNGVRELMIDLSDFSQFRVPNPMLKYRLPDILLSVSMLESLTLYYCDLPSSLMLGEVKFKSLIKLKLVNVPIDDEVIKHLAAICPLLQVFQVITCDGFKRFCVYEHQNLQEVSIYFTTPVERIDIEAPNLTNLDVMDLAQSGPSQINLASCRKLTSVSYKGYSNDFSDFVSNFPFVENLFLATEYSCNNLKLSSPSLKTLVLCSKCDLDETEFNTPNLGLFIYDCSDWYHCPVISHLPHLKACMRCYPKCSIDALWFQKLRFFFGKKNGFKALNLYIHMDQNFIVLENLKVIELPPYELEHIELHIEHQESSDHAAFVDAVLQCFRPRSLTLRSSFSLTNFEEQSDLVKFTYEKLLEQEDQGHSNIQVVSPSSSKAQKQFRGLMPVPEPLPFEEKSVSFIKEKEEG